jgi:hypothetical protein
MQPTTPIILVRTQNRHTVGQNKYLDLELLLTCLKDVIFIGIIGDLITVGVFKPAQAHQLCITER